VTVQPLNPDAAKGRRGLIAALVGMAAAACIVAVLLVLPAAQADPYSRQTLELSGSSEKGGRLFRLNCAGCHGIAAQGSPHARAPAS
jgi:mono/diheme cytochrome c family protein